MKRLLRTPVRLMTTSALVLSQLVALFTPAPAIANTWTVNTSARTQAQVQQKWAQYKPTYTGAPYATAPKLTSPYAAGSLASGFANDGLKMLNYTRFLAGLPDDVTLSASLNSQAQHAAAILAINGVLSHTPTRPAGMTDTFYQTAYDGAWSSNIGRNYATLARFQTGCISDNIGVANLEAVGHRRWLLNPQMRYSGMGYAERWVATYVFDRSRAANAVSYSSIAWPSAGSFPVQMFCNQTPWSISLNPATYDIDTSSNKHTVTLTRVADKRTWTFNSSHTNTSGHYFSTDFRRMGIPNVFVFRPDPSSVTYRPGDAFDVRLSVYVKGSSTPRTISYRTRFVSMNERDLHEPDDTRATASWILPGQRQDRSFDYDGDRDWVYFDARKGARLEISSPGVAAKLYDSAGKYLLTFPGTKTESWTPPSTARYYLLLEGSPVDYDPRTYTLSVIDPAKPAIPVAGTTRYHTAIDTARLAFPSGSARVILSTGENFPDALAAAPLAGALNVPILLVPKNLSSASRVSGLDATLAYARDELKATSAIVLGGPTAIDSQVYSRITGRFGSGNVERIEGATRYVTANRIATRTLSELTKAGKVWDGTAFLATGRNFPDALAAAPLANSAGWPIFLTEPGSFTGETRDAMRNAGVKKVIVLGGEIAISDAAYREVQSAFGSGNVARIAGTTRYDTAAKIATLSVAGSITETSKLGITVKNKHTWDKVGVTTGKNFPDALAGGVLQGKNRRTMLLTDPASLSAATENTLDARNASINTVTLYGGPIALSSPVRHAVIETAVLQ